MALFGSLARGDARPDSDVDLMVEIDPSSRIGLYDYVGIIHSLQDPFDVGVNVANREGLKDYVRSSAERDAIYAFNRSFVPRMPRTSDCRGCGFWLG